MSGNNKGAQPAPVLSHPKRQLRKPTLRLGIPPVTLVQSSQPMFPSFIPRPFPPPALQNVPVEYVIDQLHRLAPCYWGNMETTDCTLIIPVFDPPKLNATTLRSSTYESYAYSNANAHDRLGRRVTEPNLNFTPRIVMKLHMDYLSAHSTFLRALFSGANPINLINPSLMLFSGTSPSPSRSPSPSPSPLPSPSPVTPMSPSEEPSCSHRRHSTPSSHHYPHLLPSSPTHPIVYLPVPDPSSIRLLIHYMYFGSTNYIEACLIRGDVKWDGLARNVEYLGIRGIRGWLAGWLARLESPDDDTDTEFDATDLDGDTEVEDSPLEFPRGRAPSPHRLSSLKSAKLPT